MRIHLSRRIFVGGTVLFSLLLSLLGATSAHSEKQLLWGDTHLHTALSTDSFLNQNFTIGPEDAYRFAKGQPVIHPTTGVRVQIETPLDFLVVSDHAESYGIVRRGYFEGLPMEGLGPIDRLKAWGVAKTFNYLAGEPGSITRVLEFAATEMNSVVAAAHNPPSLSIPNDDLVLRETWQTSTEAADLHNEPGRFTTLIGWEWSSIPAGANLHRVVFTSSGAEVAQQFEPFSSSESSFPEDLWRWLDKTSTETGANFVAIPHNSNISRGYMFPDKKRLRDTDIDREWIGLRAKWETVVEATQVKGDSETHPLLSPDDAFADFESYPHYISPDPIPYDPGAADFLRAALRTGLVLEKQFGTNPYRFGMIGSTDSHTGLATAGEPNFWGKFVTDSTPEDSRRDTNNIETFGWAMSASGLAAVWAEDHTREGILAAFKRREVYATTGPRIALRVYGSASYVPGDEERVDSAAIREAGVPMGGELTRLDGPPSFLIHAAKDPKSGHLDRVQMVKGWLGDDGTHEEVYDVVWAGDRQARADGSIPPVIDTVDSATGRYSNEHGAATLSAVWIDPDFDRAQPAFYYVRVLEVPTPRHSTLDAVALGMDGTETGHPVSIQERAYSSPIHYTP